MKIRYLRPAQAELDEAFEWYESQRPGLGHEFLEEFEAALRRITLYPEAFSEVAAGLRRALVARFPYGIVYGREPEIDTIIVIAVSHLHREPNYWLERRG